MFCTELFSIDDTTSFKNKFIISVVNELVEGCSNMFIFLTPWWIFSRYLAHCKMCTSSAYHSKLHSKSSVYFEYFYNTHKSSAPLTISTQICRVVPMLDYFSIAYNTSVSLYLFNISLLNVPALNQNVDRYCSQAGWKQFRLSFFHRWLVIILPNRSRKLGLYLQNRLKAWSILLRYSVILLHSSIWCYKNGSRLISILWISTWTVNHGRENLR